jgi:choline dehydrogenase
VSDRGGVLYPRGGTLGGSTAVSALVTVYPHNSDWDGIAELVGDPSWSAERMRGYFERLERWQAPPETEPEDRRVENPGRHGYDGWLRDHEVEAILVRLRSTTGAATAAGNGSRRPAPTRTGA